MTSYEKYLIWKKKFEDEPEDEFDWYINRRVLDNKPFKEVGNERDNDIEAIDASDRRSRNKTS